MKIKFVQNYEDIISVENLLRAWKEFVRGKGNKQDVQVFARSLLDNIVNLHDSLSAEVYRHGAYKSFYIIDPKRRHIHKASVRDRLLHHAVHRILYPFFDRTFSSSSFSCRKGMGLHKAINKFRDFAYVASQNHTKTCWVLQGDISKFFASIDHFVLLYELTEYISDERIRRLLAGVIQSYHTKGRCGFGVPLGNLTSQLFVNIYMNILDQWVKHELKAEFYIRYADDFVIFSPDRDILEEHIFRIREFLKNRLSLSLHPTKVQIRSIASGVDFLGWVHFPDHRVLRASTKRRMIARIRQNSNIETQQSYLGLIKHGNTMKIRQHLRPHLDAKTKFR